MTFFIRLLPFMAILAASALPGTARAGGSSSGYAVTRTANGIQLTLRFQQRDFPAHALIPVTATIRNISHAHLGVSRSRIPFGVCSSAAVSVRAVNAKGQDAEPPSRIRVPVYPCPFPGVVDLPIGGAFVEHQLVALWSPRVLATPELYNHVNNGYYGFSFAGPTARFRLHPASAPVITVQPGTVPTAASVSPPAPDAGPLYYRSWGTCANGEQASVANYWTRARTRVVSSGCSRPKQWHLDVAYLNGPVATLNLGADGARR